MRRVPLWKWISLSDNFVAFSLDFKILLQQTEDLIENSGKYKEKFLGCCDYVA